LNRRREGTVRGREEKKGGEGKREGGGEGRGE
jgi:hypothetical protein